MLLIYLLNVQVEIGYFTLKLKKEKYTNYYEGMKDYCIGMKLPKIVVFLYSV